MLEKFNLVFRVIISITMIVITAYFFIDEKEGIKEVFRFLVKGEE